MTKQDASVAGWLVKHTYPSKRLEYRVEEATDRFVIFAPTETTGRVMLPLELVREWLQAYDAKLIRLQDSPREMRTKVQEQSEWANQLHSFETHLAAVVHRWASDGLNLER